MYQFHKKPRNHKDTACILQPKEFFLINSFFCFLHAAHSHPSGRIYDFLDRVFYSAGGYDAFKFKPGAAVAVARRGGTTAALDGINKYLGIAQMPVAGSTYWNMLHGLYGEEAFQDEEGMQTMRNLARNMIWMMRCFKLGRRHNLRHCKKLCPKNHKYVHLDVQNILVLQIQSHLLF